MSEIDEIFSKSKAKAKARPVPSPVDSETQTKQKVKSRKKRKRLVDDSVQPTPVAQTVIHSSKHTKRPKVENGLKSDVADSDAKAGFTDSRGTRSRRRTEEGWAVFKEDELGINQGGGDTPLCPFDCDCCF